jgi:hypothetical protein
MYTVWCEWDIGIEGKVFATEEVAIKHANENLEACGIDEQYDELRAEGLIGLDSVEIYYE